MAYESCIVCGAPVRGVTFPGFGPGQFDCNICGSYRASKELADDGIDHGAAPPQTRHLLQAWIKRRPIEGLPIPLITDKTCADAIAETPNYTPAEKMEQLLLAYAEQCKRPGRSYRQDVRRDYPYAFAADEDECQVYAGWLGNGGLVHEYHDGITLSESGWERVGRLSKAQPASGQTCFVAMWFDDSLDEVWKHGLSAGIIEAGFKPHRVKEEIHPDRIDARIVAAIKACRFLVADVTGARPAVYYEAGLAEGLGKAVLWTCRRGNKGDMCFDTRQFRHILWDDPQALRFQLTDSIRALIPGARLG